MNDRKNSVIIESYGCTSAAGPSVEDFWLGLCEGRDHSSPDPMGVRVCKWKETADSAGDDLNRQLLLAWEQCLTGLGMDSLKRVHDRLGVIFASTKGLTDDYVWSGMPVAIDPLAPVLRAFLDSAKLRPARQICVSNACASSLAALFLAERWLAKGAADTVLIIAADTIGPFVTRGFSALKALAPAKARPFDRNRQGFYLGDAACALLVSRGDARGAGGVQVGGVALDSEGFAVTRPSAGGESLARACSKIKDRPDLIIAHGTATPANDQIEDRVFGELYKAPITSTKWSIGHTLGASGAMDMIAACEVIKRETVFTLANTTEVDPTFKSEILSKGPARKFSGANILVSSLGFGGTHGAALLKRRTFL
ncbi:MAG: beta-ketoacyl synthase N-terminal-like domain-containing protein [Bdellovibrionia bacterium]